MRQLAVAPFKVRAYSASTGKFASDFDHDIERLIAAIDERMRQGARGTS